MLERLLNDASLPSLTNQEGKHGSSTLVLFGIASLFGAILTPRLAPCLAPFSALGLLQQVADPDTLHGAACPPQWLPALLAFDARPYHDDSPALGVAGDDSTPLSTWRCNPQDGSVSQDGVTVDASIPCNWGLVTKAAATPISSCAGAGMLAAIEKGEVGRLNLQVVVVRHDEDISWSDPFAAVRTVYEKPGKELPALSLTSSSAGMGRAAPEAASVVLPNVTGRHSNL